MSVSVYARATKLTNVVGRVDYISNPDRQENLLGMASTVADPEYWSRLSAESQAAFQRAGGHKTENKCCEARELHGDLPNCALDRDLNVLAKEIADDFKERTGADCCVSIHLNKAKNNLHYHLIFSERRPLMEPEVRIADRNVFVDETGARRRTKKEILDETGQLRPGCKIVPKGEALFTRYFGEKEPTFKEKRWLYQYKQHMAAWINEKLEPDEQRTVFNNSGPYLAQVHVGKGRPAEQADHVRTYNEEVKIFNAAVRDGRIPEETAHQIKTQVLLSPDRLQALRAATHMEFKNTVQMTEELQGGVRTAVGPDEQKKRELRELYRKAASVRRAAAQTSGLERNTLQAEARKYSARIDRLRMELGYYKDEDYERKLRKIREEELRKQEWLLRCRSRVAKLEYRVERLQGRVKYLERRLAEMPWFFLDAKEKAEKARLEADLKEARSDLEAARYQEAYARYQYRQEKKLAKEKRKELKQERRQVQKIRSRQHER